MSELRFLDSAALGKQWSAIAHRIAEMAEISGGRLKPHDIAYSVLKGEMQLWQCGDSLMLSQVLNYPHQRDAQIFSLVGEKREEWMPLWPQFEAWARTKGCQVIRIDHCRPGWRRVLEPLGFSDVFYTLEKRLPP